MSIPKPVYNPPFNVTRASHSVLTVKDLAKSRNFYVDLIGFIVSDEDKDAIYLRGVAEACHHSLVLKRARGEGEAERVGMRVFTEEDLEKAKSFFEQAGLPATWVEVPYQGRTLHVNGRQRCADRVLRHHGLEAAPRRLVRAPPRRGAAAARSFPTAGARRAEGLRVLDEHGLPAVGIHLARRQRRTAVRLPAAQGQPARHRICAGVRAAAASCRLCNPWNPINSSTSAISPPRWATRPTSNSAPGGTVPGHALFVYMRDPDGHRIELFNTHYQVMDIENEPVRWDASQSAKRRWMLPARRQWFFEASRFAGVELSEPVKKGDPMSLEKLIAAGMR